MMTKTEDPSNNYERMLEQHNLDCSVYKCWKPIRGYALNNHGRELGFCSEHTDGRMIIRWLES